MAFLGRHDKSLQVARLEHAHSRKG
jgi:hypothetical protein